MFSTFNAERFDPYSEELSDLYGSIDYLLCKNAFIGNQEDYCQRVLVRVRECLPFKIGRDELRKYLSAKTTLHIPDMVYLRSTHLCSVCRFSHSSGNIGGEHIPKATWQACWQHITQQSPDTSKEKKDHRLLVKERQIHELWGVGIKSHKLEARVKEYIDEAARQVIGAKEQAARERNTVIVIRKATRDCGEAEKHLKEARIETTKAKEELKEAMEGLESTMHSF